MSGAKLTAEKITSPMQLMAAWFSMLVLLVGVILTAATKITNPEWGAAFLIAFASLVIIIVIACVFTMLTIYRPHLQDGKEYAQWLKSKGQYSTGKISPYASCNQHAKTSLKSVLTQTIPAEPNTIKTESTQNNEQVTPLSSYSSCLVSIIKINNAYLLADSLGKAGFNVEIYSNEFDGERTYDASRQESIWVGSNVSVEEAVKSIKIAINKWPFLKYLHLSDDTQGDPPEEIHEQMFFGGASRTSETLRLSAWTNEEILSLNENMPLTEFHKAIRRKY